jgi:hypothetical protein
MGPIRNLNWSTSGMRVAASINVVGYLLYGFFNVAFLVAL